MPRASHKQAVTAQIIKKAVKQGAPLSRDLLLEAHVAGYDIEPRGDKSARQVASSYVSRNMKSPQFLAEIGFDSKGGKQYIDEVLAHNIQGTNPMWPKDKDLHRDAVKIVSSIAHEQKHVHQHGHMHLYAHLTTAELQALADGTVEIDDKDL